MVFNKKEYFKKYYQEHKKKLSDYQKEYIKDPIIKERRSNWETQNRKNPKLKEYYKQYLKEYAPQYEKKRRREDLHFRISCNLRVALRHCINNYIKTGKIRESKKYEIDFKGIIENLKPSLKNRKKYEIDHIVPLIMFDFNNPKHIKKAFSPDNIQWLTMNQNRFKGSRLVAPCFTKTIK